MKKILVSLPKPCSESWDGMARAGCNRHCATCASTVHDLRNYSAEQVDQLLDTPGEICVRAEIDRTGTVKTRHGKAGIKLVAIVGAGLSLAACEHAAASNPRPDVGVLVGVYQASNADTKVWATRIDGGRTYKTKVRSDGTFTFRNLPAGTYSLSFSNTCDYWVGETVTVEVGKVVNFKVNGHECIIVGLLERPGANG